MAATRWRWRVAGGLLGAALGGAGAAWTAPRLATPHDLDRDRWKIISPGLREDLTTPQIGRGTHVVGGALVMTEHAFFRPDMVVSQAARPVHRLELTLAAGSAPVAVNLGASPHARVLLAQPGAHILSHDAAGAVWHQGPTDEAPQRIASAVTPAAVELSTVGPQSRITHLRLLDDGQAVLIEEDFAATSAPLRAPAALAGAAGGAGFLALLSATGAAGLAWGLLLLALPLAVAAIPSASWLLLAERLYLDQTPAWILARICVGLCLVALAARALLATPVLAAAAHPAASGSARGAWGLWGVGVALAMILGTHPPRDAREAGLTVAGLALLLLPATVAWTGTLAPGRWLLRDGPALAGVAALGWAEGLLPMLLWRLLVVAGAVRGLLRAAPGPAARYLFALILLLPVGAEAWVRSTYLERAWSGLRLSQEIASEEGWRTVAPSWRGRCAPDAAPTARVVFLGGSSTGGAYQFGDEADAFFAAHALRALCREGVQAEVFNYGTGDGNTFTISRTLDDVLRQTQADVLLLYVGVNDILTRHHAQTRAQREASLAAQQRPVRGMAALGRQIRLITGLSLLFKPLPDHAHNVSAVPLSDAEENHHLIARTAHAAGARVLWMTEMISASLAAELTGYDTMQRRVAAEHPHVSWLDVHQLLGISQADTLLVDRNHLSREGNQRLGEALATPIQHALP